MEIPKGLNHSAQGWTAVLGPTAVLPWEQARYEPINPERVASPSTEDEQRSDATPFRVAGNGGTLTQGRTAAGLESGGPTLG